ncbi:hypothetical protein FSP39_024506 [Pinctada imbricata]|uniref:Sulfatase N-terminal domain-containing protein n=1 Tax=Pinctada imbricata TaxID=66713 RepID=A0AA88XYA3_PINIB|nr:hypothetical protein FSP39_024506 [Pinctada imbricata]
MTVTLKLICVLLLFCFTALSSAAKPNIIFILADDYGFNDIGYHGSEIKTPNLDKLAQTGVRLENYYVQPICTPTRSQLMSGRYQIHTGLQHSIIHPRQPHGLPLENPTMADKMREAGYSTHMVGKWHLGFYKKEYFASYLVGAEDYFTHYRCEEKACGYDLRDNLQPVNYTGTYSAFLFAQRAQKIIHEHESTKFQSVHAPLEVPEQYMKPYQHIKNTMRRKYAGMVSAMDEAIGNITETLKEAGMWNNTILFFSTDNGGQVHAGGNNYPLRGWKGSLWEGGMHGVGFVHSELLPNKGTVNTQLIHVSDWFPTIVGLAGGTPNGTLPLDGFDQWSTISQTSSVSPRTTLLHNIDPLSPLKGNKMFNNTFDTRVRAALRYGDWKIITGDPGNGSWVPPPTSSQGTRIDPSYTKDTKNVWLFNIAKDPNEHQDLSDSMPDLVVKMLGMLDQFNKTAVPCVFPPEDPKSDPKYHGGYWGPWE